MFSISKLLQAARSWRRRRGAKTAKRRAVGVEQLDHRQLLSVNFTGNVPIDFPATQSPGVVIFNSSNTRPISLAFSSVVSGFVLYRIKFRFIVLSIAQFTYRPPDVWRHQKDSAAKNIFGRVFSAIFVRLAGGAASGGFEASGER